MRKWINCNILQNILQNHFCRNGILVLKFHHCNSQVKIIFSWRFFLKLQSYIFFLKMLPSTTVAKRRLSLWYTKSKIRYIFCNKPFKAFLEGQVSKDKPTRLFAIKNESTKLRALLAKNVLACQRALRVYVLTCQRALRADVLTCLACLLAYLLTCLACLRAHLSTCLACLGAHVP